MTDFTTQSSQPSPAILERLKHFARECTTIATQMPQGRSILSHLAETTSPAC